MNNSYTISDLFSMYYEKEFSETDDIELPDFSGKHKRKMNKIFQVFDRNRAMYCNTCSSSKIQRPLNIRKRILIAVMIVVFLAVATGCVIAFVTNSFRGTVYSDNTHLFAFNEERSPKIIERQYTLSILPERYELYRVVKAQTSISTEYRNADNQSLTFEQTVKCKPHEVVCLNIAPDNERVLADFMESMLFVERKRFLVFLPDPEPDVLFIALSGCGNCLVHKQSAKPLALIFRQHIYTLDFQ